MWARLRDHVDDPARVLARWWGAARPESAAQLRRRLQRRFAYRGLTTLELRDLAIDGDAATVAFYARPLYARGRQLTRRARTAAFARQLFTDAVEILRVTRSTGMRRIELSAWAKPPHCSGMALRLLATQVTAEMNGALLALEKAPQLDPYDILHRLPTRAVIDRSGSFRGERRL